MKTEIKRFDKIEEIKIQLLEYDKDDDWGVVITTGVYGINNIDVFFLKSNNPDLVAKTITVSKNNVKVFRGSITLSND
jgi:hypothetical protein